MYAPLPAPPHHIAEVAPHQMLAVGGPVYDPPYATPLEDELAWHLVKYLKPGTHLDYQAEVTTAGAVCWVDFVITYQGRSIALECGALNPEGAEADDHRTALLMGTGAFDVLYRLPGLSLFHHMEDVLFLLAQWHPELFTDRAQINLERLASTRIKTAWPLPEGPTVAVTFGEDDVLQLERLRRTRPADWLHDYDYALAHYGSPAFAQSA